MFYMAGLYNSFKDKNGKPFTGFVIITTSASTEMRAVHDRMPAMLTSEDTIKKWLGIDMINEQQLKSLLRHYDRLTINEL